MIILLSACNKKKTEDGNVEANQEEEITFDESNNTTIDQTQDEIFEGKVMDLLKRGGSLACQISSDDNGNVTDGTMYISDGNLRGDFSFTQADGVSYEGSMINDGEFSYVWGDNLPFGEDGPSGVKTKVSVQDQASGEKNDDDNQIIDMDDSFTFNCQPWSVDNSKFTPPSDVEFVDLSADIQNLIDTTQDLCGQCEAVPAEGRAACLQALGC